MTKQKYKLVDFAKNQGFQTLENSKNFPLKNIQDLDGTVDLIHKSREYY